MRISEVHNSVAGRVRYSVPGLRNSPSLQENVQTLLLKTADVRSVRISRWTENVLVLFRPDISHQVMRKRMERIVCQARKMKARKPSQATSKVPSTPGKTGVPAVTPPAPAAGPAWHTMPPEDAAAQLDVDLAAGLTAEDVLRRRQRDGENALPTIAPPSDLQILAAQFRSLPVALLAGSAVLSLMTGGILDAVVTIGVVLANGAIGYVNEGRAERTIHLLTGPTRRTAMVVRAGVSQEIPAEDLVPGDLVMLRTGSYVPADVRLIEVKDLAIDESLLTGESLPQGKFASALAGPSLPLAERRNLGFMGTVVTAGSSTALVVATGVRTEVGQIQQQAEVSRPPATAVQVELENLGRWLVYLCGGVCGAVMALSLMRGAPLLQALRNTIALAVAAVPEGLPMIATSTLALAMRELRDEHVLVRRLDAVESLAAVDVLCLDKTGTLTHNHMSVVEVQAADRHFGFDGRSLSRLDDPAAESDGPVLKVLLEAVCLCNESDIAWQSDDLRISGSPTERALVELAHATGIDPVALRRRYPQTAMDYRREGRRYMVSRHRGTKGRGLTMVKGSPEEVLRLCSHVMVDGRARPLTDTMRGTIVAENERMAGRALRVLGVATRKAAWQAGDDPVLTWIGLVGMRDRLRQGMDRLMATFHQAGIRTVMITGDQSATAYAVARELDLSQGEPLEILDSTHLEELDDATLTALAPRIHVFARVSPAHKLQIVEALQGSGHTVAMTGDGINDGPALRRANVGIAMGREGSAVARDVADIVLETDDLHALVKALIKGRSTYANIHRSLHFLLATNLSEIGLMLASAAVGAGSPLNPMQLLWLNLVTDVLPGLGLAVEPPDPRVLDLPPRPAGSRLVGRRDLRQLLSESSIITAGGLAAYLYGVYRYGIGPHASTIASISLTTAQLLHAHIARTAGREDITMQRAPANRMFRLAMLGSFAAELAPLAIPPLGRLLHDTPLTLSDGLVSIAAAAAPFAANEALQVGYFDPLRRRNAEGTGSFRMTNPDGVEEQG
jgi:Ca2+-transporting ATPase